MDQALWWGAPLVRKASPERGRPQMTYARPTFSFEITTLTSAVYFVSSWVAESNASEFFHASAHRRYGTGDLGSGTHTWKQFADARDLETLHYHLWGDVEERPSNWNLHNLMLANRSLVNLVGGHNITYIPHATPARRNSDPPNLAPCAVESFVIGTMSITTPRPWRSSPNEEW